MPTPWLTTTSFPTRYVAFDNPGAWHFLDIDWSALPVPDGRIRDVRWTEMAVYSHPPTKAHAEVGRMAVTIRGRSYFADVSRDGRGETLLAFDFNEAVQLAAEWLGLR
jgi:hypothetical protein